MSWEIISSAQTGDLRDLRIFRHEVRSETGATTWVTVHLTKTLLACGDETLPKHIADAKATSGRSAIERFASWKHLPGLISVNDLYLHLFQANGWASQIWHAGPKGQDLDVDTLREHSRIRRSYGRVEQVYEYRGPHRWVMLSMQDGAVHREDRLMLAHVVEEMPDRDLQRTLDLDREGTSLLSRRDLDPLEVAVLHSLYEAPPYNSVDEIFGELSRDPEVTYEGVEDTLDRLLGRGYVEEHVPGRWQLAKKALQVKSRFLATTA